MIVNSFVCHPVDGPVILFFSVTCVRILPVDDGVCPETHSLAPMTRWNSECVVFLHIRLEGVRTHPRASERGRWR